MRKESVFLPILLGLLLVFGVSVRAQSTNGVIDGRVTDKSGAVIAGATVSATNPATSFTRETVTNTNGDFRIPDLPAGTYTVTVQAPNFSKVIQKDVELAVGQSLRANYELTPGGVSDIVEVSSAEVPLIQTTQSEVGGVVSPREIQQLPIKDRNFASLAYLIPTASPVGNFDPTKGRVGSVSLNGGDGRNFDLVVDGSDNRDNVVGGFLQNFTTEGIQEFNIVTHKFTAEGGKTSGGIVNVVTKSGTNELHGSLFGYFRADALNARNAFEVKADEDAVKNGQPKPGKQSFSRQNYGGSVGGPFKKDKVFFFAAFEATRERTNNIVDRNLLSDLRLVPGANPVSSISTPFNDRQLTTKIDWLVSSKQNLSFRYADQRNESPNDQVPSPANTDLSGGNSSANRFLNFIINHSYTFSPSVVNAFNVGYSDFRNRILSVSSQPNIAFPNGATLGANVNVPQTTDQTKFQVKDTLSWIKGRHNFKMGFEEIYEPRFGGSFFFGANGHTLTFFDNASVIATDKKKYPQGFATPGAVQELTFSTGNGEFGQKVHQFGAFFQDDFKYSSRLTLNLGIRWDVQPGFYIDQSNNRTILALKKINHPLASKNPETPLNQFQPRVGFAYDLTGKGKQVIRGGYGIFWDQVFQNLTLFSTQQSGPTIYATTLDFISTDAPYVTGGSQDPFLKRFRFGVDPLPTSAATTDLPVGSTGRIIDPNFRAPYNQEATFGYSAELSQDWALSIDYVHQLAVHEHQRVDWNPRINGVRVLAGDFVKAGLPANRIGQLRVESPINRSRFDSLTIEVKKRLSNHYQFNSHYTLSRSVSYGGRSAASYNPGGPTVNAFEDIFGKNEFGRTNNDARHRFVFSGILELPFGLLVSPILQAEAGRPYTLYAGRDINGDGNLRNDRAVINGAEVPVSTATGKAYFQVDLRVTKNVKFRREGLNLALFGEFFNVFNRKNFGNNYHSVQADLTTFQTPAGLFGGGSGDPFSPSGFGSAVGIPFQAQFGARFTF
ncbi:MAG: TonB-dependent receptor [Blastocatellia bacterium]|nr:TonB-dependent receptor [Blastocatellia bacterium]